MALRARNVDAVARAAAHLAFDENHEGAALPADITFTAFEASQGKPQRGARDAGNKGPAGGFEQRLASVMAGDAALALESIVSMAVFDEPPPTSPRGPCLRARKRPRPAPAPSGRTWRAPRASWAPWCSAPTRPST